jgi:hypothetical protein
VDSKIDEAAWSVALRTMVKAGDLQLHLSVDDTRRPASRGSAAVRTVQRASCRLFLPQLAEPEQIVAILRGPS